MPRGRYFPLQTVSRGQTGNFGTMLEAVSNSGPWAGQLGMVVESDGKVWRLVELDYDAAAVDAIDGGLAYWEDRSAFTVHFDESEGELGNNGVAGGVHQVIDVSTLSENQYMWVQIGGTQAAVVVAASTVAGDTLTGGADNVLTRTAQGTAPVDVPVAVAASTRGTTTSDEGASVGNSSAVVWILGNML